MSPASNPNEGADMSLYSLCSRVCDELIAEAQVFTEADVVIRALVRMPDASPKELSRYANQVVGTQFRSRKLCRYGPVEVPGLTEPDYARIAAKIAYASADDGPESFQGPKMPDGSVQACPNGRFDRLMIENDPITRQGRRIGSNRDDLVAWCEQDIKVARLSVPHDPDALTRENATLRTNLGAAHQKIRDLEAQVHAQREHSADPSVKELAERLTAVESQISA